jgi:hypothetical protein
VIEIEQQERKAARREKNRINQQNHRERKRVTADSKHVIADGADTPPQVSQVSPPREISTPSSSPSSPSPYSLRSYSDGRDATRPINRQFFLEFWQAYPKRDGSNPKAPAEKRFIAACKAGAEPEAIIAGAKSYASKLADKVGTPFVMQAMTWLNRKCWIDYGGQLPLPAQPSKPKRAFPSGLSVERMRKYAIYFNEDIPEGVPPEEWHKYSKRLSNGKTDDYLPLV